MFGKVEDNNNSYFTSEQIALLMAVDPGFKDRYEKEQDLKNQIDYEKLKEKSDAFNQRMPLDGSTANMMDLNEAYEEDVLDESRPLNKNGKGDYSGGFAILPLAAKIVAPLAVKGLIKGVKWLIKKKKGKGICAPNGRGIKNSINDYMNRNRNQINQFNKNLMHMNGKQAWRNILKFSRGMASDILKNRYSDNVPPELIDKKMKRSFNKIVPYKFKKLIKMNKNKPINNENRLNNINLAKPVIKYGINEIAGSGPISEKAYKISKKHIINNCGYYGNGKISWKNIRKVIKYGLSKGLEYLKGFGDKFIHGDNIKNAVDNVLNNFEMLKKLGIDNNVITEMGQDFIQKGYEKGYDKIQDKLKDDDYDEINNKVGFINKALSSPDENVKGKFKKGKKAINNISSNLNVNDTEKLNNLEEGESTVLDNGNLVGKFGFGLKAPNSYRKNGNGAGKHPAFRPNGSTQSKPAFHPNGSTLSKPATKPAFKLIVK